jgi:hypothetical protein
MMMENRNEKKLTAARVMVVAIDQPSSLPPCSSSTIDDPIMTWPKMEVKNVETHERITMTAKAEHLGDLLFSGSPHAFKWSLVIICPRLQVHTQRVNQHMG